MILEISLGERRLPFFVDRGGASMYGEGKPLPDPPQRGGRWMMEGWETPRREIGIIKKEIKE